MEIPTKRELKRKFVVTGSLATLSMLLMIAIVAVSQTRSAGWFAAMVVMLALTIYTSAAAVSYKIELDR